MTLREGELTPRQQRQADDDEVLTFKQWCRLNKISERNGRRILDADDGPVVTKLSARRIGITRGNNRKWQRSRER